MNRFFLRGFSVLIVTGFFLLGSSEGAIAATTYDFTADTIGSAPANTTATGGTLQVVNNGTLGKALQSATQNGFISGLLFNQFASSTDYSVTWKQAYSSSTGAGGMTLRAQSSSMTYAGHTDARLGYLFQINSSTAYIWRINTGGFTSLASASITKASPQYYKAIVQGNNLGFYYSNDGTTYTRIASTTDSTYASGLTQYTAGYGGGVGIDAIDDVTYSSFTEEETPVVSGGGIVQILTVPNEPSIAVYSVKDTVAQVSFSSKNQNIILSSVGFEYWKGNEKKKEISFSGAPQSIRQNLFDLSCGTTYFVRGYSSNQKGTTYSETLSFTTGTCNAVSDTEPGVEIISSTSTPFIAEKEKNETRDLQLFDQGEDVQKLQTILLSAHLGEEKAGLVRIGATGYFGEHTRKALAAYQREKGIVPAVGYFGPRTREVMKRVPETLSWW